MNLIYSAQSPLDAKESYTMAPLESAKASELAAIARELGAEVLEGDLRHSSRSENWQLGDVDLAVYLDRYRDQRLMVVVAPIGRAGTEPATCEVCGFELEETDTECPRCKLISEYTTDAIERRIQEREQLIEGIQTSPDT
jgi:rubrerythrin